jgi:DNA-binding beta-propeller fold protein YncE
MTGTPALLLAGLTACGLADGLPGRAAGDAAAPEAARFLQAWGRRGEKPGEFNFPIGIAVGPNDEVFVTDFYNDRVQRFTAAGKLLACFAVQPHPAGIAVDRSGAVYVSHFNLNRSKEDQKGDRLTVYDPAGKLFREWGKSGKGDGDFEAPGGIAIARNGEVYVTDQINHRVQVFTPDGKFLRQWGRHGSRPCEFGGKVPAASRWGGPHFLAFDRAGNVYTTEGGDYRVQKFTAGGAFLLTWGDDRDRLGSFGRKLASVAAGINGPIGICAGPQDRVWVAAVGGLVQQFSSNGRFLQAVGQTQGTGPGEFQAPHGLAMDSQANLYVVDTYNHRVQKFATAAGR